MVCRLIFIGGCLYGQLMLRESVALGMMNRMAMGWSTVQERL